MRQVCCWHGYSCACWLISTYASFCVLPLLHALTHTPCCRCLPPPSCCPVKTGMMSFSLWLRMREKTRSKIHSSGSILQSGCLFHVSLFVCLSDRSTSGHPDSPATPPGLCVRRKEDSVVTQEGGFGERQGGSVKGCLSWSWSTPLEPLTIERLFGQGQGQAQACVSKCVHLWLCTNIITQREESPVQFCLLMKYSAYKHSWAVASWGH